MDPFTQRMLERARARQEKIDQKLANSGQVVPKRKPLSENLTTLKSQSSPVKSPHKTSVESPKKLLKDSSKSPRRVSQKADVLSPAKIRNDVVVTKKEFQTPRGSRGSSGRRNSDVSVEINIMHRNDIQIEVQVEERDAPMGIVYDTNSDSESGVVIKEIEEANSRVEKENKQLEMSEKQNERGAHLRRDVKSRLDRLGNLYSDTAELSSPIHRTELEFSAGTPPLKQEPRKQDGKKKFGRLAALADQINNWEDDLTHHTYQPEQTKKASKFDKKHEKLESSTLDVSIHSINDINKALQSTVKSDRSTKVNSRTFTKSNESQQRLDKKIVAELEGDGYRRVSAGQSRLVYDFKSTENPDRVRQEPKRTSTTPSAAAAPNMATMVASPPNVTKKPSIKKYKAPVPPRKVEAELDNEKDKENNATQNDDDTLDCKQTKAADEAPASPVVKRMVPKLNGNIDRSSVLSKAAMFEAGSPRAKEKDPAEMSLRERKALFEKNKGAAIIPKAPFGLAPSVKTLHGDNKAKAAPSKPATPTKPVINRTDSKDEDTISQSSLGGGIKDKLAALLNKEQTISETTIQNKFRQEREREMEMLNNRFNVPSKQESKLADHSDDEHSDNDPSENAPLMGSTTSLAQAFKKPEIIANIPKLTADKELDKDPKAEEKVIGTQPVKRRSSQDSPVVLSVLEDVKRIKVNSNKKESNGTSIAPTTLYPHLSDIETDNSHTHDEYSDCGGSSSESTAPDNLNKSENWAETSFSRDVMNVVKKNNTSYKKAVKQSDSDESGDCDSELDDLLDEAMNDSEGPTPPKQNKNGALSSSSFVYQQRSEFKSPQKPAVPVTPSISRDRGNELVHSVSFYRRMQNASSTPTTPMRTVRHSSPDRDIPSTPCDAPPAVTTVRQRIKELQQEIVKQQTIISQASQALNLCAATVEFSGSTEQAEGERLLLLATHRRQACVHEVQRLQVEGAGAAGTAGMATLHVTGLSVPLRRDYIRQLNADGAVGHHCVCLLKCRDRVLATSMQLTRPTHTALQFPDDIRMEGLASDFKVTIEIYLLQASKENLPHEVKYHIANKKASSKLLLTPKSKKCMGSASLKTPTVQSPGGPAAVRSPHFALHGYCIFALSHHNRNTFTLSKVPCGSPLEGSVNINISARVRVPPPDPHAAFLTAFDDVSGLGAWHRRWFRLQPPTLAYWKYPDDVTKKMPIGDIDLNTVISEKVVKAPRDLCARPNTLLLESSVPAGLIIPDSGSLVYVKRPDGTVVRRHLLAADTPKDRDIWLECLNQALEYVRCSMQDDD